MYEQLVFLYNVPYIASARDSSNPQIIDLYGGRDRTRTCDLLRVKDDEES